MTGKLSRENLVYSIEMTSIPLCMVQLSILKIVFLALNQTLYMDLFPVRKPQSSIIIVDVPEYCGYSENKSVREF